MLVIVELVAPIAAACLRHTYRSLLDETGIPIGVPEKLMRHSNVARTMHVYGSAGLRAKQRANPKVVQMAIPQEQTTAPKPKGIISNCSSSPFVPTN